MQKHPFFLNLERLEKHFAVTGDKAKNHLNYYIKSLEKYTCYLSDRVTLWNSKKHRQIEKDERFWVAACMINLFYGKGFKLHLASLLKQAFPRYSEDESVWQGILEGKNNTLFFEANLPAPKSYREQFEQKEYRHNAHYIPYIREKGDKGFDDPKVKKSSFEGPTNVDAIILNESGFALIIEAKVLSDMSCDTTFNMTRNQIVRSIDVMLERNTGLTESILNDRNPDTTFFLLLTPEVFRSKPHTRHYGYVMEEYMKHGNAIQRDLPHRKETDFDSVSRRVGWLTFEDFNRYGCCPWLVQPGH